MNRLVGEISRMCSEFVLTEKLLIAPSLRVGHQWVQSVVRSGQPVVNLRVETLLGMALRLAGASMAKGGTTLASSRVGRLLVDEIWAHKKNTQGAYLFLLDASSELSETIHRTLTAIRLAGVGTEQLRPESFEVPTKAAELSEILHAYEGALKDRHLLDHAGVLAAAIERLHQHPEEIGENVLVLLPEDVELAAMERRLIEEIPKSRLVIVPVDAVSELRVDDGDKKISIFQAVGEVNEVREVIRRCLACGATLDDAELLYTESATYLPLVYELAERLNDEKEGSPKLGVTFAEGVPVRYSRPGRALLAWLDWMENDYPQAILVRMIQDGLLNIQKNQAEEIRFFDFADLLRSVSISFGRDRYILRLDDEIEAIEKRVTLELRDEDGEKRDFQGERETQRLQGLRVLRQVVADLLTVCPIRPAGARESLDKAAGFLENFARTVSEFDSYSREALRENILDMAGLFKGQEGNQFDVLGYLKSLPEDVRVGGSGPRPGCLHVSHALSGGHSGRNNTFVVGMDDSRFPGAGIQDPILLDRERKGISADLRTAADNLQAKRERFGRLLARLRGNVTLSFSCRDLLDDRETFPSSAILSAYRAISGNRTGDQSDLLQWLGPPASFVPEHVDKALDQTEWWMWRLCGPEPIKDPLAAVEREFPHLARGSCASAARASTGFTVYDGLVKDAGKDYDPSRPGGRVMSASSIETLGKCPLGYFFKYILRIEPPEDLEIDPAQWLNPMQLGSLLHAVFQTFMNELLTSHRLPPRLSRDEKRLVEVLQERIEGYKRLYPPPNANAYERQLNDLLAAGRIFLQAEEAYCRQNWPAFMEASIGLPAEGDGTALDTREPVSIRLPSGRRIRVRGRVDRVDRIGREDASDFAVWDYKSGSSYKFRQSPPFWQGRVLQHTVYLYMVSERLRQLNPKAAVKTVGYFLPGRRAEGERIPYDAKELAGGLEIIECLCQAVSNGAFICTDAADDCGYCDYADACGDVSVSASAAKRKLEAHREDELAPFRKLRGYDDQK